MLSDDDVYELVWRPHTDPTRSEPRDRVLLLARGEADRRLLAEALHGSRCEVVTVGIGPDFVRSGSRGERFVLAPGRAEHHARMWDAVLADGPVSMVVHAWSLKGLARTPQPAEVALGRHLACDSLVHLAREIEQRPETKHTGLLVITRGAVATGADSVSNPMAALSWGITRTLASEFSGRPLAVVDVDEVDASLGEAVRVLGLSEDQFAVRAGNLLVPRMVRPTRIGSTNAPADIDLARGVALVAGGLGGIGSVLLPWLVQNGCHNLLVLGRRQLSDIPGGAELLNRLTARGARADYVALDLADRQAVRETLTRHEARDGIAVEHVFQLAGAVDYAPVSELTGRALVATLRGKVDGSWSLHEATARNPLQTFVLFSSGSAYLSSPLLGAYAAANAFADSLAWWRHAHGRVATAVSWGFWADVGLVDRGSAELGRTVLPRGMRSIPPASGLQLLGQLLESGRPHSVALPTNWADWARAYPSAARAPVVEELVPHAVDGPTDTRFSGVTSA